MHLCLKTNRYGCFVQACSLHVPLTAWRQLLTKFIVILVSLFGLFFFSKISIISKGTQVTRDLAQQIGKLPTAMASGFQVGDVAFSFFPAPPPSLPSAPAPLWKKCAGRKPNAGHCRYDSWSQYVSNLWWSKQHFGASGEFLPQFTSVYLNFSFVFFLFQICFCFLLSSSKRSERSLFLWDWLILGGFGSEKDLVGAEELTAVVCPRIC